MDADRHLAQEGPPDAEALVPDTAGIDLLGTCRPLADGASDPTWSFSADLVARALTTPDGPVTVLLHRGDQGVRARTWGPGSDWLLPRLQQMLGDPTPPTFRAELHPVVQGLHRRFGAARIGAGLRLVDVLVPTVLGQRVTSAEARRTWWQLVRRIGTPAPGPGGLLLPPPPEVLVRLRDGDWHRLGVERQRADAIRRLHAVLGHLESAADRGSAELQQALCAIPGIGPWTATSLAATVLGDPDAVLLGDLHLPNDVCFALAGEPRGDDDRMEELLEPWRGERLRVVRLLRRGGPRAPRRGPRYRPLPIARW